MLGDDADIFRMRFGVLPDGNAPSDPQAGVHRQEPPLHRAADRVGCGGSRADRPTRSQAALERSRLALFARRGTRPRPHLDDKVLTAWNGLMIAAFARASRVLSPHVDARPARRSRAVSRRCPARGRVRPRAPLGRSRPRTLLRRYPARARQASRPMPRTTRTSCSACSSCFRPTVIPHGSSGRSTLQQRQDEQFWDPEDGGWFSTTGRDPSVLLRLKEDYDGAEPAASSVSVSRICWCCRIWSGTRPGHRRTRSAGRRPLRGAHRSHARRVRDARRRPGARPDDAGCALDVSCRGVATRHRWRPGRGGHESADAAGRRAYGPATDGDRARRAASPRGARPSAAVGGGDGSARGTGDGVCVPRLHVSVAVDSPDALRDELARAR